MLYVMAYARQNLSIFLVLLYCHVVMLSCCYVVMLLCCRMNIPDLPTYFVFYLKTTRMSSIYSTYLIYPDLFILHTLRTMTTLKTPTTTHYKFFLIPDWPTPAVWATIAWSCTICWLRVRPRLMSTNMFYRSKAANFCSVAACDLETILPCTFYTTFAASTGAW